MIIENNGEMITKYFFYYITFAQKYDIIHENREVVIWWMLWGKKKS